MQLHLVQKIIFFISITLVALTEYIRVYFAGYFLLSETPNSFC